MFYFPLPDCLQNLGENAPARSEDTFAKIRNITVFVGSLESFSSVFAYAAKNCSGFSPIFQSVFVFQDNVFVLKEDGVLNHF